MTHAISSEDVFVEERVIEEIGMGKEREVVMGSRRNRV